MKDGKVVEEGTHQSLLADSNGVYHNLVTAQHLDVNSGDDELQETYDINGLPEYDDQPLEEDKAQDPFHIPEYKDKGILRSLGLFLYEQKSRYIMYLTVITSAAIAGGKKYLHGF
jgi:ATP-binding cassette, subfamily B (MDR/TAP), member 1